MVDLVRNLSAKYLRDPKCFTLLTIPMTSMDPLTPRPDIQGDIETQNAFAQAMEHDEHGHRRVGISEIRGQKTDVQASSQWPTKSSQQPRENGWRF